METNKKTSTIWGQRISFQTPGKVKGRKWLLDTFSAESSRKKKQRHNLQSLNLPGLQHIYEVTCGDDAPTFIGITCHLLGSHSFHCTTDFLPILSIACQISTWVVIGWTLTTSVSKSTQSKRESNSECPHSRDLTKYVHIFSRFKQNKIDEHSHRGQFSRMEQSSSPSDVLLPHPHSHA